MPRIEFDVHASWQARVLKASRGKFAAVVMSVLAQSYDEQMPALLALVFPNFTGIAAPFFCSAARISARGRVYCQMVQRNSDEIVNAVVYANEQELQAAFRNLADTLKFSDADRMEMFAAVRRWIVCDYRINPNTGEKDKVA